MRVGFGAIKNFPLDVARRIIRVRREGAFEGLDDFLRRVRPGREAAEKLVRVGGFDRFGIPRERLLLELDVYFRAQSENDGDRFDLGEGGRGEVESSKLKVESRGGGDSGREDEEEKSGARVSGFGEGVESAKLKVESCRSGVSGGASSLQPPASSLTRHLEYETELLGFGVSAHPLQLLPEACRRGTITAREMRNHVGRRVTMIGWLIAAKLIRTHKSREFMKFLSLEDLTDTFEVTLFPRAYRRFAPLAVGPGPFRIRGKIEDDLGAVSLVADQLEIVRPDEGEPS